MKGLFIAPLLILTACQHVDPSDCKDVPYMDYHADKRLSPAEADDLERGQFNVAQMSGWACGFRDGVRSRKLVIDLP